MDIIAETLRWVNAERQARSIGGPLDELPRGQFRDCYRCPVALALGGAEVSSFGVWFEEGDDFVYFPPAVAQFVCAFDDAQHPELVGEDL